MEKNKEKLTKTLLSYDCISFDIFDTLVCRCLFNPNDLIRFIDYKVCKNFKCKPNTFISLWNKAINFLHKKYKKNDPNFNAIYKQILSYKVFNNNEIKQIKKIHLETELTLDIPRTDMLNIFNTLVRENKQIIIVSDMYYDSNFLKKILNKCGYQGFKNIFVSNEIGGTKNNGALWKKLIFLNKNKKWVHVGDNIKSDYFKAKLHGIKAISISSGIKMAKHTYFNFSNLSTTMSIMYGLIINKYLFNSPFSNNKSFIDSTKKYGYSVLGPVFLYFISWLIKNVKTSQFLFISREGWYLRKLYNYFIDTFFRKKDAKKLPRSIYLYTSRRAVLASSIKNWNDIKFVCTFKLKDFCGDSKLFFKNKFNIDILKDENFNINKHSASKILELAKKYEKQILTNCKKERQNYLIYLKNNVLRNSTLIDYIGLGTTQYYLSRLLKQKILGVYITKAPSNIFDKKGIKRIGVFPFSTKNHYTDIFESFLVAPHGQFLRMDHKIKPIFAYDKMTKRSFLIHEDIYASIEMFFKDFSAIFLDKPVFCNKDSEIICSILGKFFKKFKSNPSCEDLINLFTIVDVFSGQYIIKPIKK